MNRIRRTVDARRAQGAGIFVPFVVLGDPDPATSLRLIDRLVVEGADMLELGLPFSDPPADGPVIQAADQRALAAGTTPPLAFEMLDEIQRRHDIPVGLLVYYNLVLQYGVEAFYDRCARAGVDGVLVADVPLEESRDIVSAARSAGIAPVFIGSTLSSDDRLAALAEVADGYLYAVARIGVTGGEEALDQRLAEAFARFHRAVDLPVIAGFGISTPAQVKQVLAAGADGAITGSALVRRIEANLERTEEMLEEVGELAGALSAAAHTP